MTPKKKPAPKKRTAPSLADRLLMAEQLIAGQRRDFDELGTVLHVKDLEVAALKENAEATRKLLLEMTGIAASADDRLRFYEARVPNIKLVKKQYDAALAKKVRKMKADRAREELAKPPESA